MNPPPSKPTATNPMTAIAQFRTWRAQQSQGVPKESPADIEKIAAPISVDALSERVGTFFRFFFVFNLPG
jgi:hypothetical protein